MKNKLLPTILLIFLAILVAACSVVQAEPAVPHGGPTVDYVSFVDDLRQNGAAVSPEGEVNQPFLRVTGQTIQVNGAAVQVYEYADAEQRAADSDQIGSDGSEIGRTVVDWVDQPNFWAVDHLIVLYVGRDPSLLALLNQTLGEPLTPHSQVSVDDIGAVQLSEAAQTAIDLSRAALAQQLDINPDHIELDSITEPAAADGTYIVKLMAEGKLYEYHVRNGEALLVSDPLPTASDQFTFNPAVVESIEVQIDESAPAPVSVIVRGHLPDNCTEIHEGLVEQVDEQTFAVSLSTRRPARQACGEVLVSYETAVSLGVETAKLPAGEYTVIVNDQMSETFTLNLASASGGEQSTPDVVIDLDEAVATGISSQMLPAVEPDENIPYFGLYPERLEVDFEGYAQSNSMHLPKVYVYPIAEFMALNETAREPIEWLQDLLIKKPNLNETNNLPFLPFFNAQSMMHVRGEYLSFENGSGIRYLTQFGQAAGPINNFELLYTFQGLTDDGQYYIAAVFPVAQADLPADLASADASFPDGFESYIEGVKAELVMADPGSFTPSLDDLDALTASIQVVSE